MTARVPDSSGPLARRARIAILALGLTLAWACAPFLAGLLGAVVLAVVCAPAYRRLHGRFGDRATALALTVGAACLLVAPAIWLVATAIAEAPDALERAASSVAVADLGALRIGPFDVGAQLARIGDQAAVWVSQRAVSFVGGLTLATLNLVLALVGLFYLLRSGSAVWAAVRPIIPFSRRGSDALGERFVRLTEATLLGIAVTAIAQGLVVGVAFFAVGLPNALVWGVITALVSILPVLGSALVWGPGVLVLLAEGRYGAAVVLLLAGVIVASNIDNVLLPVVYRRVSGLHPMATLVGAFAGMKLLGLPGLLLGPLSIAYAIELLRIYHEEYGDELSPSDVLPAPAAGRAPRVRPESGGAYREAPTAVLSPRDDFA